MMARMGTSRNRASALLLGALLLASAAGCDIRRETSPSPTPTAGQYEQLRNEAAQEEAGILNALDRVPAGDERWNAYLVDEETRFANAHLNALGGVYVPFPTASPTASPTATVAPPTPADLVIAAAHARDADLSDALVADDPELALVLASIGLSHAEVLAVSAYRGLIDSGNAPLAAERPAPGDAFATLVPSSTALDETTLEGIIVSHDYASYLYEVIAARTSGDARTQALARSRIHAKRADDLVALASADPRNAAYVIDHDRLASVDDMNTLARETEAGIADRYITAFSAVASLGDAGRADRAWLISAAFDALVQGALWPGATPADADPLPGVVLPGEAAATPTPTPSAS